jgi:hypothetical protein
MTKARFLLKALIVTADESLRAQLRGLRTAGQVDACQVP